MPLSRVDVADVVVYYIQLEVFSSISRVVTAESCLFLISLYSNSSLTPEKKPALYIQRTSIPHLFFGGTSHVFAYRVRGVGGGRKAKCNTTRTNRVRSNKNARNKLIAKCNKTGC